MGVRAYLLFDIVAGNAESAVQKLRGSSGVVLVDWLEGQTNVITVVEAPSRERLAEVIMPVIGCIAGITEDLKLLITRDSEIPGAPATSGESVTGKIKVRN